MNSILMKTQSYIILITLLITIGDVVAQAVEYNKIQQYYCNLVYAVVISLFTIENWTLLTDLNHCSKIMQDKEYYMNTIQSITKTNHALTQRNNELKDELAKLSIEERERGSEAIKCIMNWRQKMNFRLSESDISPSIDFIDEKKQYRNIRSKSLTVTQYRQIIPTPPPHNKEERTIQKNVDESIVMDTYI